MKNIITMLLLGAFFVSSNGYGTQLSGTYTVGGTSPNYSNLTAAFADLVSKGASNNVIFELQSGYLSTGETFPLHLGTFAGAGVFYVTIRPKTFVASPLSISSSNSTATINLDGEDLIVFDGRPGGIGSDKYLIIENTSTSAPAIRFINYARECAIRYCTVKASNASVTGSTAGVILFSTDASGSGHGNDDNTISYCNIDCNSASAFGIYSKGTSGRENSSITISNNNIFNFYLGNSGATVTAGILIDYYNTGWTITGNSIYQTTNRSYYASSTSYCYGIDVEGGGGDGFTISNNYIGGSSASAGGTWYVTAGNIQTYAMKFFFNGGVNMSSIQGNTVTNMSITSSFTSADAVFLGLWVSYGPANIGTSTPNTIGSTSTNGAIIIALTGAATGASVVGAYLGEQAVTFSNNNIGGIVLSLNNASCYGSFYGIYAYGAAHTISGNTIGSATVANSINLTGSSTSSNDYCLKGIEQDGNYAVTISGNTIANLTMSRPGSKAVLQGIYAYDGTNTISGNTIHDLSSGATNTRTGVLSAVSGIVNESMKSDQIFSGNTIYNLSTTDATNATQAQGMLLAGSNSNHIIRKNKVYGITTSSSNTNTSLSGIVLTGGSATISNNMVSLGNSLTTAVDLTGINVSASSASNIFFNTAYVTGSNIGTSGITKSQAFGRTNSYTDDIRNNIFINTRSNGAGTQKHYAIKLATPSLTSNYNVLYASGTGGTVGTSDGGSTDYSALSNWQSGTSLDANSKSAAVTFVDAVNGDLHLSGGSIGDNVNLIAQTGSGVTDDFDGDARNGSYPYKGADENTSSVLPIQLTSFVVSASRVGATLNWSTATETNNYGFEIERKESGQWQKVGFVEGNGTSNAPHNYSFTEGNMKPGIYSYRLKQIDRDGNFEYSKSVGVEISVPRVLSLSQNYPNPFNPTTTITFTLAKDGYTSLKVFDVIGREVKTLVNETLEAGVLHEAVFNASQFTSGIYLFCLESGGTKQIRKMVLMK